MAAKASRPSSGVQQVLRLQRSIGNRATLGVLRVQRGNLDGIVQRMLTVGKDTFDNPLNKNKLPKAFQVPKKQVELTDQIIDKLSAWAKDEKVDEEFKTWPWP